MDGDLACIELPELDIGDVDGLLRRALFVLAVAFLCWKSEADSEAGVGVSGVRGREWPLLGGVTGDET